MEMLCRLSYRGSGEDSTRDPAGCEIGSVTGLAAVTSASSEPGNRAESHPTTKGPAIEPDPSRWCQVRDSNPRSFRV